jgi:hypothetical protein
MFLEHVLDLEKIKEILEGFIICHGTMFLHKIKHNSKLDLLFFLFPNLPQNQLISHIVMKIGNIFGIIVNITLYHPRGVYLGLLTTNMLV